MIVFKCHYTGKKIKSIRCKEAGGHNMTHYEILDFIDFSKESFKFIDCRDGSDITAQRTLLTILDNEGEHGDVKFLHSVVRLGGFLEYIKMYQFLP